MHSYSEEYWALVVNGLYYDGQIVDPIQFNPSISDIFSEDYKIGIVDTGAAMMALPYGIMNKLFPIWT